MITYHCDRCGKEIDIENNVIGNPFFGEDLWRYHISKEEHIIEDCRGTSKHIHLCNSCMKHLDEFLGGIELGSESFMTPVPDWDFMTREVTGFKGYSTIAETAKRWGLTEDAIRMMIKRNIITESWIIKVNTHGTKKSLYLISDDLAKPTATDNRGRRKKDDNIQL